MGERISLRRQVAVLTAAPIVMTGVALFAIQLSWRAGIVGGLLGLAVAAASVGVLQRWQRTRWAILAGVFAGVAVIAVWSFANTGGTPDSNALMYTSILGAGLSAVISILCLIGCGARNLSDGSSSRTNGREV